MDWGGIKAAVTQYAHRTDLAPLLPTFLELAEQRIYRGASEGDVKPLRISPMLKTVTLTAGNLTLPADFLEALRVSALFAGGTKRPLDFQPITVSGNTEGVASSPSFYTIRDQQIVLSPSFSQDVELWYYSTFAPLVADADTNWITQNAPKLLIHGLLIEVGAWMRDDALTQREMVRFASAVNSLQSADDGNQRSGMQLRMISDSRRLI